MALPELPLRPGLPELPVKTKQIPIEPRWTINKLGYNSVQLMIRGTFTRTECYRLIGELERTAADL